MKKVLMNRKPVEGPWGGGNLLVKAIVENAEKYDCKIVHRLSDDLDAILMVDPRRDELGISVHEIYQHKQRNPNCRIVHRVNECDARKGTHDMDPLLVGCSKFTDATVFVSNWMMGYFQSKGWATKELHVVTNGVNKEHFSPQEKIDNGKINLVTHHWSNNPMKGFDFYEALDDIVGEEFTFTYIGRDRGTFKKSGTLGPFYGKELGENLGRYDVYVSASRFDPGPNHVIEALACGLPTYVHRDGGGAVEFAGLDASYSSLDELLDMIRNESLKNQQIWTRTWEDCAKDFFEVINA
jgi:glycosyltransferase involved in cell wall biosynthesis